MSLSEVYKSKCPDCPAQCVLEGYETDFREELDGAVTAFEESLMGVGSILDDGSRAIARVILKQPGTEGLVEENVAQEISEDIRKQAARTLDEKDEQITEVVKLRKSLEDSCEGKPLHTRVTRNGVVYDVHLCTSAIAYEDSLHGPAHITRKSTDK